MYIRYSGEKTKTTFLKNISAYCLLQFYEQIKKCSYKSLHVQISQTNMIKHANT